MSFKNILLLGVVAATVAVSPAPAQSPPPGAVVIDDFQAEKVGWIPTQWRFFDHRTEKFVPLRADISENEQMTIEKEGKNKFLRAHIMNESRRITVKASEFDWKLSGLSKLAWKWRALSLPVGAREDKVNDSGAAVYVTFDRKDWLGRPHSIKYTYSTTLPVGATVSHGPVKVIVVSSGLDGTGEWKSVERDVAKDYKELFGNSAPNKPFSITLWSDSDDTKTLAEVDFDNIMLKP